MYIKILINAKLAKQRIMADPRPVTAKTADPAHRRMLTSGPSPPSPA
jgi:hypothetical protein